MRAVVVAGPGTGKTHTLVRRTAALLDTGELAAGRDVLVLSFTRAVIGELRTRLGDHPMARFVLPVTIDGHAGRVVGRYDDALPTGGYEATVRRATDLVRKHGEEERHRHVIVDEAQDLAEPRLSFVLEILERADGFTVLGDPAQGIYGFQGESATNALAAVRARFLTARPFGLSLNHRIRSPRGDLAGWAHTRLAEDQSADLRVPLARSLRGATRVSVEQAALVLRNAGGRTAVLCRTNGEVLALSALLHERNAPHRVQRSAESNVPPRWVADKLAQHAENRLSRRSFQRITVGAPPDWQLSTWRALRRVASGTGDDIDIVRLRERVAGLSDQEIPDEQGLNLPVLSTIHRAKGLEFDRVAVLEPEFVGDQTSPEEARVLFVAMTRARDETLLLERPKLPFRLQRRLDRWAAVPWRGQGVIAVEIRPGDVDRQTPFASDENAAAAQRHLSDRVRPGDRIELVSGPGAGGVIQVLHDAQPIAALNTQFTRNLQRLGAEAAMIATSSSIA